MSNKLQDLHEVKGRGTNAVRASFAEDGHKDVIYSPLRSFSPLESSKSPSATYAHASDSKRCSTLMFSFKDLVTRRQLQMSRLQLCNQTTATISKTRFVNFYCFMSL